MAGDCGGWCAERAERIGVGSFFYCALANGMRVPGVAGRLIGWPLVHRRSGMKRISLVHKSILLLLVVNLWAGTALARAPIAVSVNHAGSLSSNGEVVTLSGKIRC